MNKKLVITKNQKNEMIHRFDIEFHKLFYTINKWIETSESLEQLDTIYNFVQQKIDHINNELKVYWVAPYYFKSINNILQEKLQCYLDESTSNYEYVRGPIQELENKIIAESKRIVIRGFREED